jgi:hypothetical protein
MSPHPLWLPSSLLLHWFASQTKLPSSLLLHSFPRLIVLSSSPQLPCLNLAQTSNRFLPAAFPLCNLLVLSLLCFPLSCQAHTNLTHSPWLADSLLADVWGKKRRENDDIQYLNPTAKSYLFAIDNKSILNDLINSRWIWIGHKAKSTRLSCFPVLHYHRICNFTIFFFFCRF